MVRVEIDLSKYEIQMLINCIEAVIDTKHTQEKNEKRIREIQEMFSKYL
jgi:hypothetical protein